MKRNEKDISKFIKRILDFLMPDQMSESGMGDYEELFTAIAVEDGRFRALIWLWFQIILAIKNKILISIVWSYTMSKNYLKTAWRNIVRYKGYSFINISGLAIGMACSILILLWVMDENSFDNFHENRDEIYRVTVEFVEGSSEYAGTPGTLAPAMKVEIPEILYATRVMKGSRSVLKYEKKAFYEDSFITVDDDFLQMFNFPFLTGTQETALLNLTDVVISEKIASKYFGNEDPIGKTICWNNWSNYKITGVVKNVQHNSHIQFDLFDSHSLNEKYWPGGYRWTNYIHETYLQLRKGANVNDVTKKIRAMLIENHPRPDFKDELKSVRLQPMSQIHLDSWVTGGSAKTGSREYVYIFSIIAFGLLIIGCINYINLTTSLSIRRSKEIGVRKVLGSNRRQLIRQFYGESFIMIFFSTVIAVILTRIFLPVFNELSQKNLEISLFDPEMLLGLLSIVVFTGLVAGSYPSIYLSAFDPAKTLKGIGTTARGYVSLQKSLVFLQFCLSITLIICAAVVYNQIDYIKEKNLGFDEENIIYLPAKGNFATQFETTKSQLLQLPGITAVSAKDCVPTTTINGSYINWEGQKIDEFAFRNTSIEYDCFELLNMEIIEGRNFSKDFSTDKKRAFVLNEEAVKIMGLESPVGTVISTYGRTGEIVGVVKNAHFESLHNNIEPLVFYVVDDYDSKLMDLFGIILIKIKGSNITTTLQEIKNVWENYNPGEPFEYHFLDELIDAQYTSENFLSQIINSFTLLAIYISCLGLFGLVSFTAAQRTKEVAIRKTLGASITTIIKLLTKEFTVLVIVANLIAWPIAKITLDNWLQSFAYRANLSYWSFILSGIIAVVIALLTVSYHAIKSARANPINSLRYE